ncbi:MAG: hypothetical protein IPK35_11265 [Saprospiraceae bacterium]|nr:hypothetical protein [Saprospiraceae bacterium]
MRIIDEFNADEIKVTVFKMNEKISIKFEKNLLEQVYKFRDGSGISNPDMARKFCTTDTIRSIRIIFDQMAENRLATLKQLFEVNTEETFDRII